VSVSGPATAPAADSSTPIDAPVVEDPASDLTTADDSVEEEPVDGTTGGSGSGSYDSEDDGEDGEHSGHGGHGGHVRDDSIED